MPSIVIKDAKVNVNSVDLSDFVKKVTINYEAEIQDKTTMGSGGARSRVSGLVDWKVDIEFAEDYAVGGPNETLFPLVGGAAVPITVQPTAAAISPTNPSFQGNCVVRSYPPISANVGELATATCAVEGDGILERKTTV